MEATANWQGLLAVINVTTTDDEVDAIATKVADHAGVILMGPQSEPQCMPLSG